MPARIRGSWGPRADRVDRGEVFCVPQRPERRETGVQAEVPVQVQDVLLRHGDARPFLIIDRVTMGHDHVEPVHGATLEETDQHSAVGRTGGRADSEGCSGEEQRIEAQAE